MSRPRKSDIEYCSCYYTGFPVPNKYQSTNLKLSLWTTKTCNGVTFISIFIPWCSLLATHFNNAPPAKIYSTRRLKSSKSALKRGEVSWQTTEQNAMQSYAVQG